MLVLIQTLVNHELDKPENKCGCSCVDTNGDGQCEKVCGLEHSTLDQGAWCAVPNPPEWPPLLQVLALEYRVVSSDIIPFLNVKKKKKTDSHRSQIVTYIRDNRYQKNPIIKKGEMTKKSPIKKRKKL